MNGLSIPKIRGLNLLPIEKISSDLVTTERTSLYAAAKNTRLTGDWLPLDSNVNDIIKASSPIIRRRVRQLIRDFPYLARAVNVIVDYVVGVGIQFQSKNTNANGKLNNKRNQQNEDAFKFWSDDADISGRMSFYEIMRLAKRQDVEPGEFLVQKLRVKRHGKYLPFCLRVIEPDWITDLSDDRYYSYSGVGTGNEIYQGIEYNKQTGERVFYHLMDPDGWGNAMKIPASDILHGFDMLRPNQLRGISPFAPGLLLANDLQSVIDSEIDAAKMASKWLAMVTSDNPMGRQMGLPNEPGTEKKIEELENAIIEYLRPGEKIEMAANPRPGSNFGPFVRLILTMLSVTTNVPYEILTGDYQGLNFSTGKMVRTDFAQQLRPTVARHVRQFCEPIARAFMDEAVLYGKLSLPGYYKNPWPFWKFEWQPPGMESIDPGRETKAFIDQIKARLRSPQEIIRSRGRDPEAVVNEISEFKALCESKGLHMEEVISTAMANNPAAVEMQE
ncbi:MAG: phage portal protein [Pseudomonadota bacterium]